MDTEAAAAEPADVLDSADALQHVTNTRATTCVAGSAPGVGRKGIGKDANYGTMVPLPAAILLWTCRHLSCSRRRTQTLVSVDAQAAAADPAAVTDSVNILGFGRKGIGKDALMALGFPQPLFCSTDKSMYMSSGT